MKKYKNLFILSIICVFVINFIFIFNVEALESIKLSNEILTDDFLTDNNWWQNVKDDYVDYIGKDFNLKLNANLKASNNANKILSLFGEDYPSYYGGIYIDDNNNLVLQLVKDRIPNTSNILYTNISNIMNNDDNSKIEYVKHTAEELEYVNSVIYEKLNTGNNFSDLGIAKFYIDTLNNSIVVEFLDYGEDTVKKFKENIIDNDMISYKQGSPVVSTLNAGGSVGGCSVGYRARKTSTGKGFVTAGHCYCNGITINGYGTVKNRKFGGKIDALWIDSSSTSLSITNYFHNWSISGSSSLPDPATLTTTVTTPVVGQYIGKVGKASGHRLGKITSINTSFNYADGDSCLGTCPSFTNQISTSVYQIEGDSGAIVYLSSNRSTLGIGTFKVRESNTMIFSSAKNINSEFGISRY